MKMPDIMFMFKGLGVKNVRYLHGRIMYINTGGEQVAGVDKIMLGGSAFEVAPTPANDTHYNMDECDIIIIPKKRFTNLIVADGYRLDQAMLSGLGNGEAWESIESIPNR
jgi:hypothetical protein